jgi:RNA polymerase sigma-70 factor (ECF subfamily)
MAQGCESALRLFDELDQRGELRNYHLLPAARADILRRLGRWTPAAQAYRDALALATQEADRRFLAKRLAEMGAKGD